jgi:FkbM family methyltransferase
MYENNEKSFRDSLDEIWQSGNSHMQKERISNAINTLKSSPLILYGAGAEGVSFAQKLMLSGISPLCFCDKNKTGIENFSGLRIVAPATLTNEYKHANILISSTTYFEEIKKDLRDLGVDEKRIISREIMFLMILSLSDNKDAFCIDYSIPDLYINYLKSITSMMINKHEEIIKRIGNIYDSLSDRKSQEVFLDFLRFCFTAETFDFSPVATQYFDPVMKLSDSEVFVDCGAYTGDTAAAFFRNTNDKYAYYFAFEPDSNNRKKATGFLSDKPNTEVIPCGLWSKTITLRFSDGRAGSSIVTDNGSSSIDVVSIDEYFSDKLQIPTIIKMDIEGAELEALKGAEQIIRKHKPKLAICIYHKAQDLYEIPEFIKSCREDYEFYVRHYNDNITELVLYAI